MLRSRHWQSPVGPRMGGGRRGGRHTGSAGTREGRACPAPREPPEDSERCGPTCTDSGSSRKDGGKCEATQTSPQCSWNQPIQLLGLHQCPSPRATAGASQTLTLHTGPMPISPLHSHRAARTIFLKPKRSLSALLKALQHCRPQSKTLIGLPLPFHGHVPPPALLISLYSLPYSSQAGLPPPP